VKLSAETDKEGKEKAQDCVEMTKKFCHITRSIEESVPIKITSEVVMNESE
jgi:organic hydroperoxide reductase OsmC/OhrA